MVRDWLDKLRGGKRQGEKAGADAAAVPPGVRVYAVGDIHGRLDLLEELHERIRADGKAFDGVKKIVYLGDFVDRGAQSKQVLDLLTADPLPGFESIHLMGNHEQVMLEFLADPWSNASWLEFGGRLTLLSYGVAAAQRTLGQDAGALRDELQEKMPTGHVEFLKGCRPKHIEGGYCFVHAGVKPGVSVEEQKESDLFWVRDEFLQSTADHGYVVVHGHTIFESVDWSHNRIGIDTGAFQSGVLTALVLEGRERRLLQTGEEP